MKKIKLLTSLTGLASLTAITLPLAGCSCTNPTDPTVHTVESVLVLSEPTKTEFKVGETFNAKGLILQYKEEDGSLWQTNTDFTTDYDDYTFTNADVGEQTVTVTYKNKTCTYKINVKAATPVVNWMLEAYIPTGGDPVYAYLDESGKPSYTISVTSGQIYKIGVNYDPTKIKHDPDNYVFGILAFDSSYNACSIFSETSGDFSVETSLGNTLKIAPLSSVIPGFTNYGYVISDFDPDKPQQLTIQFKINKSAVSFCFEASNISTK